MSAISVSFKNCARDLRSHLQFLGQSLLRHYNGRMVLWRAKETKKQHTLGKMLGRHQERTILTSFMSQQGTTTTFQFALVFLLTEGNTTFQGSSLYDQTSSDSHHWCKSCRASCTAWPQSDAGSSGSYNSASSSSCVSGSSTQFNKFHLKTNNETT